jgi:hypothetical protein
VVEDWLEPELAAVAVGVVDEDVEVPEALLADGLAAGELGDEAAGGELEDDGVLGVLEPGFWQPSGSVYWLLPAELPGQDASAVAGPKTASAAVTARAAKSGWHQRIVRG